MLIFQGFSSSHIVCDFPAFSFKVWIATPTRNQFASNRTRVRIPLSAPNKDYNFDTICIEVIVLFFALKHCFLRLFPPFQV